MVSNLRTVWGEYWRSTKTFATFLIIFLKHILMAAPRNGILGWESFYAAFCHLSSSHNLFPQPLSYLFRSSMYHIFTFLTVYAWYQRELAIYFRDLNYRLKLKGCKKSADTVWNTEKNQFISDVAFLTEFSFCHLHLKHIQKEQLPAISCTNMSWGWMHNAGKSILQVMFQVNSLTLSLVFWKLNRIPCGLSDCILSVGKATVCKEKR